MAIAFHSLDDIRERLQGEVDQYRIKLANFRGDFTQPSFRNNFPEPPGYQDWDCSHPNMLPRLWVLSNGVKRVALQCQACGDKKTNEVRNVDYPGYEQFPPFDYELSEAARALFTQARQLIFNEHHLAMLSHDQRREEMGELEQLAKSQEWWIKYNNYLLTAEWKDKRERVLDRDDYLCQACLKRRATQAHHLTYKRVFNEPLFDLAAVCDVCHRALHPHMEGR